MSSQSLVETLSTSSKVWFIYKASRAKPELSRSAVCLTRLKTHPHEWELREFIVCLPDLAARSHSFRLDRHVARAAKTRRARHSGHVAYITVRWPHGEAVHPTLWKKHNCYIKKKLHKHASKVNLKLQFASQLNCRGQILSLFNHLAVMSLNCVSISKLNYEFKIYLVATIFQKSFLKCV